MQNLRNANEPFCEQLRHMPLSTPIGDYMVQDLVLETMMVRLSLQEPLYAMVFFLQMKLRWLLSYMPSRGSMIWTSTVLSSRLTTNNSTMSFSPTFLTSILSLSF
ncbi:hypothetical protein GmHk_05G012321 [Glycine max]|nr:hypothetical protein GmHk_05G012321 [Glycine max]